MHVLVQFVKMYRVDFSPYDFSTYKNHQLADEEIYGSVEFRMYAFKIKKCPRMRSHDWTECPYAHKGEKAQRRDPRKYNYEAIICPQFRNGNCYKGDLCEYAHGVFEYWLHPNKYRTRPCNAGIFCDRKVCFFAHTPQQLRVEPKSFIHHQCCHHDHVPLVMQVGNDDSAGWSLSLGPVRVALPDETASVVIKNREDEEDEESYERIAELVKIWKALKIKGGDHGVGESDKSSYGFDISELSFPEIDWIKELVQ